MSIAPLKKVTLVGPAADKEQILVGLQSVGCMHLLPLRPPPAEIEKVATPRAESAYKALNFLNAVPNKRRSLRRDASFDVDTFTRDVLELKQQLRVAGDRRDFLVHRIAAIEPWGDIVFPPKDSLNGYRLWFFVLPLSKEKALAQIELPWQIVRRDHRSVYVVVIAQNEPPIDLLPVQRTHVGSQAMGSLRIQLEDTEVELEELQAKHQALTQYLRLLKLNLAEADNRAGLTHAAQQTLDDDAIVAVQGWVPVDAIEDVEAYARRWSLACAVENPGQDDKPPTLLDQPEGMAAGVDLALFYQVPGYHGWDPTWILAVSFSVFFAMILADAGYGLLLLGGLMVYWKRLGGSPRSRSYRRLAASLFGSSIVYGTLVGSYFGVTPTEGSMLARFHVLSVGDFDTMMRLSIVVGVLHIALANAMMAYVNRSRPLAVAKLGWIAVAGGGLGYWLTAPTSFGRTFAIVAVGIGLTAVALFSSERPVLKPVDYLRRLADGVFSLKGVLNLFGDVLSYLRLFALGLASGSLAMTFNDLAHNVHESLPGIGVLAALLILAIGHGLNLILSVMSGVVHGLRLNVIEFFNWGLSEEGTLFRSFSKKEVSE